MRRIFRSITALLVPFTLVACSDDDDNGTEPDPGPFTLTFQADASFQGAHGGQDVRVALVRESDGTVVSQDQGIVGADSDPVFSFTFTDLLQAGESYQVHYWIDSNFGGGTAGVCDEPAIDHQWDVALGTFDSDRTHTEDHRPTETAPVCGTFGGGS